MERILYSQVIQHCSTIYGVQQLFYVEQIKRNAKQKTTISEQASSAFIAAVEHMTYDSTR